VNAVVTPFTLSMIFGWHAHDDLHIYVMDNV